MNQCIDLRHRDERHTYTQRETHTHRHTQEYVGQVHQGGSTFVTKIHAHAGFDKYRSIEARY